MYVCAWFSVVVWKYINKGNVITFIIYHVKFTLTSQKLQLFGSHSRLEFSVKLKQIYTKENCDCFLRVLLLFYISWFYEIMSYCIQVMLNDNHIVTWLNFIRTYSEHDWNVLVRAYDILYMLLFWLPGALYVKLYVFKTNTNIYLY